MKVLIKILCENTDEFADVCGKLNGHLPAPQEAIPLPPVEMKHEEPEVEQRPNDPVTCKYDGCGNPFNPETVDDLYCSKACAVKASKLQKYVQEAKKKRGRPKLSRNL